MDDIDFVPTLFKDTGKVTNDLFKKKFDLKKQFNAKHSTSCGLVVEPKLVRGKKDITGTLTGKYTQKKWGSVELKHVTEGTLLATGEFTKLQDGLKVKTVFGTEFKKGKDGKPDQQLLQNEVSATYKAKDFFATTFALSNLIQKRPVVKATASIGTRGVSVSGLLEVTAVDALDDSGKVTGVAPSITDRGMAFEWAGDNFTASAATEKSMEVVTVSFSNKVNADYSFGARAKFSQPEGKASTMVVEAVAQQQLDRDTLLKGKIDTKGSLTTALQHQINSPSVQVLLSGQFDTVGSNAPKFGLGLTIGEF